VVHVLAADCSRQQDTPYAFESKTGCAAVTDVLVLISFPPTPLPSQQMIDLLTTVALAQCQ
jgi:hypothetical protein